MVLRRRAGLLPQRNRILREIAAFEKQEDLVALEAGKTYVNT